MLLTAGDKLGHYEILAAIGAGGMGEVYRARDSKLNRDVAIKVLSAALATDADYMARFQREAHVLASLNHPNIAAIYGLENRAIVMELVEGPTLADRLAHGPLPIDDVLPVARQIAQALEAAHEKGIVHRDLKPANLKVTPEGVVKVLDFGLAAVTPDSMPDSDPTKSPTLTMRATREGIILGTVAYMSPEQATGGTVDRRTDIWSFGVVLFEMLTGQRLFHGETATHTLADVLRAPIDFNRLPPDTPIRVRELLTECLERNVKNRLRDIGDARILIEDVLRGQSQKLATNVSSRRSTIATRTALAILGLTLFLFAIFLWRWMRPADHPLMQLAIDLGPDAVAGTFVTAAVSPDGMRVVFPSKSSDGKVMLATKTLSEAKPVLLPGTGNGRDPFFSPDGRWIGFFADRKMKKISIQGGAPVVVCDASDSRGADWGKDGNIIAALNTQGALSTVPSDGGAPQAITKLQGSGVSHRWPQWLPGTDTILFTLSSSTVAFEDADIATASRKTGEIKTLIRGGYFGRYIPLNNRTGVLTYVHDGVLFGVGFDAAKQQTHGAAIPLLDDVAADPNSGAGQFSFSTQFTAPGTFLYRKGKVSAQTWPLSFLAPGKTDLLISMPGLYFHPRFASDGQHIAFIQGAGNGARVIICNLQRDTMTRVASSVQQPGYPTWTPDGRHIVLGFRSGDGFGLGWIRSDGGGELQSLITSTGVMNPFSFFPDGKRLAYYEADPGGSYDIWTVALDIGDPDHPKAAKPEAFLRTPANERHPAVSPDGRWIAYSSDESGRAEVYVRPFPGPDGKWQISNVGGQLPVWSRTGRELFFQNLDHRIMVTDYVVNGGAFDSGKARLWSDFELHYPSALNYDLAPDGKRFVVLPELKPATEERPGALRIGLLLNFSDELRRRIP